MKIVVRDLSIRLLRNIKILIWTILGILAISGRAAAQGEFFIIGGLCLIPIIILIVFIIIALWVYRDAESRGMSGVLWLLVVLVGGIIGLIVYLIVRKDHPGYSSGMPPPQYYNPAPPCPRCRGVLIFDYQNYRWYCRNCEGKL
jgi:hypothetical protein